MRLRALLLSFVVLLPLSPALAHAAPTQTESTAIAAAENDHSTYSLPPEKLAKAQHLESIQTLTHFGSTFWSVITLFLILQLGVAARIRNVANNLSRNRWAQCFIFFLLFLILSTILDLPISLYAHHVQVEYGLSVQHWGSWFGDQLKSFLITYLVGGLLVMLLFWRIRRSPRYWWLQVSVLSMVLVVIGIFITPYVIDPLFNKFEPLEQSNPALVAQLEKVVARGKGINIPPDRMFLMKASDKVTTLNAYVTGFGASKRVVVWDTSIAKATPDEVLFIFGHEMGHYVLGHIVRSLVFSFLLIFLSFYLGHLAFQWLLRMFGKRWRIPTQDNWAALYVLLLVLTVLGFFAEPIANAYSRSQEHAADVYGEEVVQGIVADPQATGQAAFQLLGENSFDDPNPNPLVEFWTGSHPPIWFRAAFAKDYQPFAPGAEPKYFKK